MKNLFRSQPRDFSPPHGFDNQQLLCCLISMCELLPFRQRANPSLRIPGRLHATTSKRPETVAPHQHKAQHVT